VRDRHESGRICTALVPDLVRALDSVSRIGGTTPARPPRFFGTLKPPCAEGGRPKPLRCAFRRLKISIPLRAASSTGGSSNVSKLRRSRDRRVSYWQGSDLARNPISRAAMLGRPQTPYTRSRPI
jgi:hypothetical protein